MKRLQREGAPNGGSGPIEWRVACVRSQSENAPRDSRSPAWSNLSQRAIASTAHERPLHAHRLTTSLDDGPELLAPLRARPFRLHSRESPDVETARRKERGHELPPHEQVRDDEKDSDENEPLVRGEEFYVRRGREGSGASARKMERDEEPSTDSTES